MPDQDNSSATPAPGATVSFTASDALAIAKALGAAAVAINPAVAGAVAIATGLADLLRETVLPAVQHLQAHEISVVQQAVLAADSAAERARVGAPSAASN